MDNRSYRGYRDDVLTFWTWKSGECELDKKNNIFMESLEGFAFVLVFI